MNFIQPWILVALPLIAVPIIIHLVNQRRFQTVPWAAMMFLMQATRMSAGYTKLRQWLILLMRTLAVACLIFFTSRPLASGLIGLLGSRSSEVAIVLLDRSPSMQESQSGTGMTKLQSALTQLSSTLRTLGVQRVVLFDSAREKPIEYETPASMVSDPTLVANGVTSDFPGLLERALLYVKNNQTGNVNVWICSDMRESDWRSRDGRWAADREGFMGLPQDVKFQVLDVGAPTNENRSIRVLSAKRIQSSQGIELSIGFRIERILGANAPTTLQIPVEIEVGGSRTVLNVDLQSESAEVNDYRIALSTENDIANQEKGWGLVRIPGDTNMADNTSYFVYEKPAPRRTVIVSDNPRVIEAIELCTNISPEVAIECETETVSSSQLDSVDWNSTALVVWHEQLPTGRSLELLTQFLAQGGQVLLFPPETPNDTIALGVQWMGWESLDAPIKSNLDAGDSDNSLARVQQWRNDSELLGNTLNGAPLPVGQLGIKRICKLRAEGTVLAAMSEELPLLMRIDAAGSVKNGVYVCTTTPSLRDSTFASDGIVMYIAIQRVLAAGSARIGSTRSVAVGQSVDATFENAVQTAGDPSVLTNQYSQHPGVYQTEELLVAQNRLAEEDSGKLVSAEDLSAIFGGLNWSRIEVGSSARSLVQEIWRWFLISMLIAMVVEAILCMPKRRPVVVSR